MFARAVSARANTEDRTPFRARSAEEYQYQTHAPHTPQVHATDRDARFEIERATAARVAAERGLADALRRRKCDRSARQREEERAVAAETTLKSTAARAEECRLQAGKTELVLAGEQKAKQKAEAKYTKKAEIASEAISSKRRAEAELAQVSEVAKGALQELEAARVQQAEADQKIEEDALQLASMQLELERNKSDLKELKRKSTPAKRRKEFDDLQPSMKRQRRAEARGRLLEAVKDGDLKGGDIARTLGVAEKVDLVFESKVTACPSTTPHALSHLPSAPSLTGILGTQDGLRAGPVHHPR